MGHSLALSDVGLAPLVLTRSMTPLEKHSRTLMDLSTEFERSLSSRLDSVYELLDGQISRVFAASVRTAGRACLWDIPLALTILAGQNMATSLTH
jgi:hypothetical protein